MKGITIRRKYGNQPVEAMIEGRRFSFRSKLEYRWAQHLEFLRMAGEIRDWFYEFHTFRWGEGKPTEYTPDFLVRNNDNTFEYYETKGMVGKYDIDKLKRIYQECPSVKITVVFWSKPKLTITKRTSLARFSERVIWNAKGMLKDEPIDMT